MGHHFDAQGWGCYCLVSSNDPSGDGAVKAKESTSACLLGFQGFPLFSESFILLASDMDEVCSSSAATFFCFFPLTWYWLLCSSICLEDTRLFCMGHLNCSCFCHVDGMAKWDNVATFLQRYLHCFHLLTPSTG